MSFKARNDPFFTHSLGNALGDVIAEHGSRMFNNCSNCSHMAQVGHPVCRLFNSVPPIQTIMKGCKHYNDGKEIPF